MNIRERACLFNCAGEQLVGVVTQPEAPRSIGVVIVVGGPQYRVGSHRQFVHLARALGALSYPVFRFDVRGMGDSSGAAATFESIEADIHAAATTFRGLVPAAERLVLWGLCDAASAALMAAPHLERLCAVVLANPWVRTESSHNRAVVRHYYLDRLLSRAFWTKLLAGDVKLGGSLRECLTRFAATGSSLVANSAVGRPHFVEEMVCGWQHRGLARLVILSGHDLTAREFEDLTKSDRRWSLSEQTPNLTVVRIPTADHTFSSGPFRNDVAEATGRFLDALSCK